MGHNVVLICANMTHHNVFKMAKDSFKVKFIVTD